MDYEYKDYFPLKSKQGVTGAYEFLIQEECGQQVECIKRIGYNTYTRRLMVAALICEKELLDKFLKCVWIHGNLSHRQERMDTWHARYKKRLDLQQCW